MSLELPITDYIDTHLNTISSQILITEAGQKMMELGVDSVLEIPININAIPNNLPTSVTGTISPYPTVVTVAETHQNASIRLVICASS